MLFEQNIASNVTRKATLKHAQAHPSTQNNYWEHIETF